MKIENLVELIKLSTDENKFYLRRKYLFFDEEKK